MAIPLSLTGTRLAWTQHIPANHFSLFPTSAMESPNLWLLHLPRLPTRPFGLSAPSTESGGFRQFVDTAFLFGVQRVSRKNVISATGTLSQTFLDPKRKCRSVLQNVFLHKITIHQIRSEKTQSTPVDDIPTLVK